MTSRPPFFDRVFAAESRVRLADEDPDLFARLPPADQADASARAIVRQVTLERGTWEPGETSGLDPARCLGLLVLDGPLIRSVQVGSDPRAELLGPGGVIRPWEPEGDASVPFDTSWRVVARLNVAILDESFLALTRRWPQITVAVVDRVVRRSRRLALQLAIADLRRVDDRLMLLFWHLADRWGRVGPDGVVVPLPVTHEILAQLICAQRPTVTSALRRLSTAGRLRRRRDRTWLLAPEPPPAPRRRRAG